jgi:hypothetical protein
MPLWVYGFVFIMYIAVRIAFNITISKEAAEKEDSLIEYILDNNRMEDEVYCNDEIKDRLLLKSKTEAAHVMSGNMDSWELH